MKGLVKGLNFQVRDLGVEHPQYFAGFGVAFTPFTDCAVGSGSSAQAAGEDALEQFWMNVDKRHLSVWDAERLENTITELSEEEDAHDRCEDQGTPSHDECEMSHYVGIRWVLT